MEKKSKFRAMLEQGCIAEWYTLNGYFLKLYPCFEIDKVKFSFVMKGKKGEGFDIYVDTDDFSLLCDDIISLRMAKKISKDAGQYPGAWKYATGENGALIVAIGKSQKGGIVIQGRNGNTKANAFVPLTDYNDLRKMAFLYNIISGKEQTTRYYAELVDAFWNRPKWNEDKNASNQPQNKSNGAPANRQANVQNAPPAPAKTQQQTNRYGNRQQNANRAPANAQQQNSRYGNAAPANRQPDNRSNSPAPSPAQQFTAPPPPPGISELDVPFDEMPSYGSGYGGITL